MTIDFPFEANWAQPVDIERAYKTEIIESRDLTEQRKAQRQQPRRVFEFSVQSTTRRARDLLEYMEQNMQEEFSIPDFSRVARLGAAVGPGDTTINVPGADQKSWIYPGAKLFLGSGSSPTTPELNVHVPVDSDFKHRVEASGSSADYSAAAYNDSAWDVSQGPFGDSRDPDVPQYNTRVNSGDLGQAIWIRFEVPAGPTTEGFTVTLWHDDGVTVWVDGVLASLPAAEATNKTVMWIPATSSGQIVAVKVVDGVPSGDATSTLAGVAYVGNVTARETVRVVSISGDDVTVTPVRSAHAVSGMVRPAVIGQFDQRMSGAMVAESTGQFDLVFNESPNASYSEGYYSPAAENWFDGREVLMVKPDWSEPASARLQGYLEVLDMSRGVLSHRNRQPENLRTWEASYRALRAGPADALVQLYHRVRGRRSEFFMPTFKRDFDLVGEAAAGASFVTVQGSQAFFRYAGSSTMNRIAIIFADGSYEFHKLDTITQSGANSSLGLRDVLGATVNSATVDRVCWLPLWRMASDKLGMSWLTTESAEAKMSMQQLVVVEGFTGVFPLVDFTDGGDQTYDMSDYGLIATGATKGALGVSWVQAATAGQNFTLDVLVEMLAGDGTTVLTSDNVVAAGATPVTATGTVDIPQAAKYARVTFTKTADNPGATTFGDSSETVSFGGIP